MDWSQIILNAIRSVGWPEMVLILAVIIIVLYFFIINPKVKAKKKEKPDKGE